VTVKVRQHNEQFAMISVADTGYGIHPEDLRHIFERFYQSNHSQQSKMGGYGLGLSIAKLIIEQHGGTINVDTSGESRNNIFFHCSTVSRRLGKIGAIELHIGT